MKLFWVFVFVFGFHSAAHADDCTSVKRSMALAAEHDVDTTSLTELKALVCKDGEKKQKKKVGRDCKNLRALEMVAAVDGKYLEEVRQHRVVACSIGDGGKHQTWRNGENKYVSGTWYWPNGRTAKTSGTYYYASGRTASTSSTTYYPNGRTAFTSSNVYEPGGKSTSSNALLASGCAVIEKKACRRVLARFKNGGRWEKRFLVMRMAWLALAAKK